MCRPGRQRNRGLHPVANEIADNSSAAPVVNEIADYIREISVGCPLIQEGRRRPVRRAQMETLAEFFKALDLLGAHLNKSAHRIHS